MITIESNVAERLTKEQNFRIFKHNNLICCIQRMRWSGNLNGYVAVSKDHALFGKKYSDKIKVNEEPKFNGNYIGLLCTALDIDKEENTYSIDMAIDVHGGLTYSENELNGIDKELFGELWWFGFDTLHSGDLKPFQTEIDKRFPHSNDVYRDFEYVEKQTIQLAEQLYKLK